jgi:hypothetical protein
MTRVHEQYRCNICNYPVEPKGETSAELVTAWVTNGRVIRQTERTWRFAHRVCIEYELKDKSQGELF